MGGGGDGAQAELACTRTISEFALVFRGSCEPALGGARSGDRGPAVPAAAAADIFLRDCAPAVPRPSAASSSASTDDADEVSEPESDSVCTSSCAAACLLASWLLPWRVATAAPPAPWR